MVVSGRRYSSQLLVVLFILIALAIEGLPLWAVSYNRIENPRQFHRTVTTETLATVFTISVGSWLFMRVTRRLTSKLEESEKLHRELFASIKSPVAVVDEQLNIIFCNDSCAAIGGYRAKELTGRNLAEIVPDFESRDLYTATQAVLRTGWHQQYVATFGNRELEIRIWRAPEGLLILADDITEKQLALKAARRLAAVVESTDDAIIAVDLKSVVTDWNKGAERIYGYTSDEVCGRSIRFILPPGYEEEMSGIFSRVSQGQVVRNLETQRMDKDGRILEVALTVSPIFGEGNKVVGISAITRDITQSRQLQHELTESRHKEAELLAIQRTAATAAHEINNPLAAQMLLLQTLQSELEAGTLNGEAGEMLDQALGQSHRIGKALEALQNVSDPTYKTYIGRSKILDLHGLHGRSGSAIT
jgi:PAS domain S-box-containing protein